MKILIILFYISPDTESRYRYRYASWPSESMTDTTTLNHGWDIKVLGFEDVKLGVCGHVMGSRKRLSRGWKWELNIEWEVRRRGVSEVGWFGNWTDKWGRGYLWRSQVRRSGWRIWRKIWRIWRQTMEEHLNSFCDTFLYNEWKHK